LGDAATEGGADLLHRDVDDGDVELDHAEAEAGTDERRGLCPGHASTLGRGYLNGH
jgi:hypothetical protein